MKGEVLQTLVIQIVSGSNNILIMARLTNSGIKYLRILNLTLIWVTKIRGDLNAFKFPRRAKTPKPWLFRGSLKKVAIKVMIILIMILKINTKKPIFKIYPWQGQFLHKIFIKVILNKVFRLRETIKVAI